MKVTKMSCPHCGNDVGQVDENSWSYGSPLQICGRCKKTYVDSRYHEIAVDGFHKNLFSKKYSVSMMLYSLFFAVASCGLNILSLMHDGSYYPFLVIVSIGCVGLMLYYMIDFIRIATGAKQRKYDKLKEASEKRLQNPEYAKKLASMGYNVPGKYLLDTNFDNQNW